MSGMADLARVGEREAQELTRAAIDDLKTDARYRLVARLKLTEAAQLTSFKVRREQLTEMADACLDMDLSIGEVLDMAPNFDNWNADIQEARMK
jgi:hypothetical protein